MHFRICQNLLSHIPKSPIPLLYQFFPHPSSHTFPEISEFCLLNSSHTTGIVSTVNSPALPQSLLQFPVPSKSPPSASSPRRPPGRVCRLSTGCLQIPPATGWVDGILHHPRFIRHGGASAPPLPPSEMTIERTGVFNADISYRFRAIASPWPRSSASIPQKAWGVYETDNRPVEFFGPVSSDAGLCGSPPGTACRNCGGCFLSYPRLSPRR